MKTVSEIDIYEIEGSETKPIERPKLQVSNHWNWSQFVVLWIDGKKYTVPAKDLSKAIDSAIRVHN